MFHHEEKCKQKLALFALFFFCTVAVPGTDMTAASSGEITYKQVSKHDFPKMYFFEFFRENETFPHTQYEAIFKKVFSSEFRQKMAAWRQKCDLAAPKFR
jgi:hypothetical protein